MKITKIFLFATTVFAACTLISSCTKSNDIDITEPGVILHAGETHQIKATSDNAISYETENPYVAKVSDSGLVKGNYVGKTAIKISTSDFEKTIP